MDLFQIIKITETQFANFCLVFCRINGLLVTAPMFGEKIIPHRVRSSLSLVLAIILTPILKLSAWQSTPEPLIMVYLAACELAIGLMIGFAASILFSGVQMAGELIGQQMGLAMANLVDPMTGSQVSIFSQLELFIAMMIFLSINGHHIFIKAVVESFRLIPPMEFHPKGIILARIMAMSSKIFILAIQIGAPTIAVLIFTNVFLALMARTVPEMNIFMMALPLSIAIGILVLSLSTPLLVTTLTKAFRGLDSDLIFLIKGR